MLEAPLKEANENVRIVDVSELDYVRNPEDMGTIIDKINGTLFGLF